MFGKLTLVYDHSSLQYLITLPVMRQAERRRSDLRRHGEEEIRSDF
jgi:hypothetical protein